MGGNVTVPAISDCPPCDQAGANKRKREDENTSPPPPCKKARRVDFDMEATTIHHVSRWINPEPRNAKRVARVANSKKKAKLVRLFKI